MWTLLVGMSLCGGVRVSVYDNGGFGGRVVEVNNLAELRQQLDLPQTTALHDQAGLVATDDSIIDGANLYTVPQSEHFYWPFIRPGHRVVLGDINDTEHQVILESVNDEPRVFFIHNFFSEAEKAAVMKNAITNQLKRSTVGVESGKQAAQITTTRTSSNAWDLDSEVALKLKHRTFQLLRMKYRRSFADGLQVVRYEPTQAYNCHHDYFELGAHPTANLDPTTGGSNRFATVFMYFEAPEAGGHTSFPQAARLDATALEQLSPLARSALSDELTPELSKEIENIEFPSTFERRVLQNCYSKLAVKPAAGTAILFYSQRANFSLVPSSLHCACPVVRGTKWGANLWVWNRPRPDEDDEPRIAVQVRFINGFDEPGELYWRGPAEKLVRQGGNAPVEPNQAVPINSWSGHKFVFHVAGQPVFDCTLSSAKGPKQEIIMKPVENGVSETKTAEPQPTRSEL